MEAKEGKRMNGRMEEDIEEDKMWWVWREREMENEKEKGKGMWKGEKESFKCLSSGWTFLDNYYLSLLVPFWIYIKYWKHFHTIKLLTNTEIIINHKIK